MELSLSIQIPAGAEIAESPLLVCTRQALFVFCHEMLLSGLSLGTSRTDWALVEKDFLLHLPAMRSSLLPFLLAGEICCFGCCHGSCQVGGMGLGAFALPASSLRNTPHLGQPFGPARHLSGEVEGRVR